MAALIPKNVANPVPIIFAVFCSLVSEFCTAANAAFVASTARSVNVASAMVLQFPVLMFDVNEPAVKFLRGHRKNFVRAFVKPVSEGVNGEEVGSFPAVN